MAIAKDLNEKKGLVPYSSKRKIRPIIREQWDEEKAAAEAFAKTQDSKIVAGPPAQNNRFVSGGASAGSKISGGASISGGTVSGTSGSSPHNPENLGTT